MSGLLDAQGNPIRKVLTSVADAYAANDSTYWGIDPGVKSGWQIAGGFQQPQQPITELLGMALDRDTERRASRVVYMTNPIMYGALETIQGFILGEGVSYGETADPKLDEQVEEFWFQNNWEQLINRWFLQYLLDGEDLTVFPKKVNPEEASRIGLYDVDGHLVLETIDGMPNHIKRAEISTLDNKTEWLKNDRFVWTAHNSLWNDPRGWPVLMQAVGPALAYVGFVNTRMRIHDVQARINAIYWAFAADNKELAEKAHTYQNLPTSGRVLTMHKLPTGEKEEFEFLETRTNASDSAADGRLIRLVLSVALNLPEHYLGEGGDVNRTTADAMGAPAKKAFKRKQKWVKDWMDRVMRTELKRRNGPDHKYTVKKYKLQENGGLDISTKQVPIEVFEFAWLFPEINDEDTMGLVRRAQLAVEHKLASKQSLSGLLGFDWAAEVERMTRDPKEEEPDPNNPNDPNNPDPNGGSKLNRGVNKGLNKGKERM